MGNVFSACRNIRHSNNEITLLLVGLDNAGKTCTAKHLCGETLDDVVPTVGFSVVHLKHKKFHVTIYDLGGGSKIRGIWKNYYASVYGVIFVVDASDASRVAECKAVITEVVQDARISGKPMLVLVNKQDVEGALDENDICTMLNLESLVNEHKCPTRVELCSVAVRKAKKMDRGLELGFHWLLGHIAQNFKELHERVEKDIEIQRAVEEKERRERLERVRKIQEEREKQQNAGNNEGECSTAAEDDQNGCDTNPFRPLSEICARLEEKEKNPEAPHQSSNTSPKVIHVSPIHQSDDSIAPESVDNSTHSTLNLPPIKNPVHQETVEPSSPIHNDTQRRRPSRGGREILPHISAVSTSVSNGRTKKRKNKKLFQNKVAPNDSIALKESASSSDLTDSLSDKDQHSAKPSEKVTVKPKRSTSNGQINWAFTEDVHTSGISSEEKQLKEEISIPGR